MQMHDQPTGAFPTPMLVQCRRCKVSSDCHQGNRAITGPKISLELHRARIALISSIVPAGRIGMLEGWNSSDATLGFLYAALRYLTSQRR